MIRIRNVSQRAKPFIWRTSGVVRVSTLDSMPLIRPISLAWPVATTTPRPVPAATSVPLKAMQDRSPSGASSRTGLVDFPTATDSPVRIASSMRKPVVSRSRRSAVTFSPASRSTMSPGATSVLSTLRRFPSLKTVVREASICRMASIACSARPSWMYPITAFAMTTARITPVSVACPRAAVMSAATSST